MSNSFSQTQEIELIKNRVGETVITSAKNNIQLSRAVSLTVAGFGYKSIIKPLTRIVNKNQKFDF